MKYAYPITSLLLLLGLLFPPLISAQDRNGTQVLDRYLQTIGKSTPPSSLDYKNAGIQGVTKDNLAKINSDIIEFGSKKRDFNTVGLYYGKHYPTYRYDTAQDYSYSFKNTKATVTPVKIEHRKLFLPENIHLNRQSIFLKINLQSDTIGKYFPPALLIHYHNKTSIHTLERGASGTRYINLSNLQLKAHDPIDLEGRFLTIPNQTGDLVSFRNDSLEGKTILIVATHPDDAEIAAFGLYEKYHNNSYVVTITAGDAGPSTIYNKFYYDTKQLYLEKGMRRTWDSLSIPALGKVSYSHTLNLGFFDGRLPKMYQQKDHNFPGIYTGTTNIETFRQENHSPLAKILKGSSNWNSLVENLVSLLQEIKPDIIVTPYSHIDRHPDHKYTTAAVFEAIEKAGMRSGKLYLYSNHPLNSEYFPFGNRWEPVDLPPNFGSLYFESIYSHPLTKRAQREKLFALEAMSDLRFEAEGSPFDEHCKNRDPLTCRDFSYFRRAVRSNELFFVVDIKNIYNKKILEAILN